MKVEISISPDITEPYAVIHSNAITKQVENAVKALQSQDNVFRVNDNERIIILKPEEIFMVRVENTQVIIYSKNKHFTTKKRLYEVSQTLGSGFMQISKSAIVNLKQIDCVEPTFKGMMQLIIKKGSNKSISSNYRPAFKKYLGL